MREFDLAGFIGHVAGMTAAIAHEEHRVLDEAGRIVEKEAKSEIGTYQSAAGPFPSWAELADVTKQQRLALGFTENDPGKRSGQMQESIGRTVGEHKVVVGSDDQNMVYFELGTSKQPPRSALGGALVRKTDDVVKVIGRGMVGALVGGNLPSGGLEIE